jgi:gliding motility-associated-like protein
MAKKLQLKLLLFLFFLSITHVAWSRGAMFVQNKGQWDSDILFRADLPGGFLFLKNKSLIYVFYDAANVAARHGKKKGATLVRDNLKSPPLPSSSVSAHGMEVIFENANDAIPISTRRPVETSFNFFFGNDPSRWAGHVSAFEEVVYENVYKGVDLKIYFYNSTLKYEFLVHPQAEAAQIALKYTGASSLEVNESGQLLLKTPISQFREAQPYCYQTVKQNTVEVSSRFLLSEGNRIRFDLPKGYNKSELLTIDPELIFSTYSGFVADNWGHTATYDDAGNLYAGGTVFGINFPATVGSFQVKFSGEVDAAILKFSPDGSKLLYATYLGGASTDIPSSLIVNKKGELLIYGATSSRNFPVHSGAFQSEFGGGVAAEPISGLALPNGSDIFVSKLSIDGKQLLASTYVGGEGNDGLSTEDHVGIRNYGDSFRGEISVDLQGNVIVASSTSSKKFPLKNPVKNSLGGTQDGVLFRMTDGLNDMLWSTYAGGNGYDALFSVKVAKNNDLYATGITQSSDLSMQPYSLQSQLKGTEDAWVVRYTGDQLTGSTYLGTDQEDAAYLLDMDQAGNVYIYGLSKGKYPVTAGLYNNANSGQFIHAVDAALSKSLFSTVLGSGRGAPDISPTAFLVSECGNIYLAGWGGEVNVYTENNTLSSTNGLPVTADAMQPKTNGNNFYLAILEEGAKSLLYATYFGNQDRSGLSQGDHVDGGTSRFDKNGMIYHATCACGGSGFPVTLQAWSVTNNSNNCNNAAFKIDIDRLKADFDVYLGTTKNVTRGCAPLSLSFANTSEGGVEYLWQINGSTISRDGTEAAYVFSTPGEYQVVLKAYNRLSCKREDIATKTIVVERLNVQVKTDTVVCENTKVQLWASGGAQYKWTPATGLDNALIASPVANIKQTTEFTVEIANAAGCKVTRKVKITIEDKKDFSITPDMEVCSGTSTVLAVTGNAKEYRWLAVAGFPATTGTSVNVKPTHTTVYVVEGVYADGCRPVKEVTVKVDRSFEPSFDITLIEGACTEPVTYAFSNKTVGAQRFDWDMGSGKIFTEKDVDGYIFTHSGEQTITLTSYNLAGCALSFSKKLITEPPFVLANVITPNSDGKNDAFVVPVAHSRFEVFNRWGKRVFQSEDYKNDWGSGVPNGTYYFVVDTPAGNHCKGWVEVLE